MVASEGEGGGVAELDLLSAREMAKSGVRFATSGLKSVGLSVFVGASRHWEDYWRLYVIDGRHLGVC